MKHICQNCSFEFEVTGNDLLFCPHCGNPLNRLNPNKVPSKPEGVQPAMESEPVQQMVCPICCCEVTADDASVQCPDCKMFYHQECWEENGGCATYGCPSAGCLNPPPEVIEVPEANAPSTVGSATSAVSRRLFRCPHCGTELSSDATFCWSCGKEVSGRLLGDSSGKPLPAGGAPSKQSFSDIIWGILVPLAWAILAWIFEWHD